MASISFPERSVAAVTASAAVPVVNHSNAMTRVENVFRAVFALLMRFENPAGAQRISFFQPQYVETISVEAFLTSV